MTIIKLVNDKQLRLVKKLQIGTLFVFMLLAVSLSGPFAYADCVY